jgi:hypothetical protein
MYRVRLPKPSGSEQETRMMRLDQRTMRVIRLSAGRMLAAAGDLCQIRRVAAILAAVLLALGYEAIAARMRTFIPVFVRHAIYLPIAQVSSDGGRCFRGMLPC